MIFVTVGTHEQPFDRLVEYIDLLAGKGIIGTDILIQTGFSTYEPKHCKWKRIFPYQEMADNVSSADIVITHGGPSSFLLPLQQGKIPIVVPRQKQFGEHINNHQIEFCREVARRLKNIILVEDISRLEDILPRYEEYAAPLTAALKSNNARFNEEFAKLADSLVKGRE